MNHDHEDILCRLYNYFNDRDIDACVALMHPGICWENGMDGGHIRGVDAVRKYWKQQWGKVLPQVTPLEFGSDGIDHTVVVKQVVLTLDGKILSDTVLRHKFSFEKGQIVSMDIM